MLLYHSYCKVGEEKIISSTMCNSILMVERRVEILAEKHVLKRCYYRKKNMAKVCIIFLAFSKDTTMG